MMVIPDRDRARVITPRRPRADDRLRLHKIISDVFVGATNPSADFSDPPPLHLQLQDPAKDSPRRELEFAVIGRRDQIRCGKELRCSVAMLMVNKITS